MRYRLIVTTTLFVVFCALIMGPEFLAGPAFAQEGRPSSPPVDQTQVANPDAAQAALGTAFTYQGNLKKSGQPVNAACSFQFSLWDALTGGSQKGATQTVNNASVQAGVFTVALDFGSQFTGDARWLQTAVRCPGDANYTALAPRQPLNAVPYALGLLPGATVEQAAANSRALTGRATGANSTGVFGESSSWAGVWGQSTSASGVVGRSAGQYAAGVYGENTGQGYGVYGKAPSSAGVFGESTSWFGVYGRSTTQVGVVGESSGHDGIQGSTTAANRAGVKGVATAADATGVWGESTSGTGVYGKSTGFWGVRGVSLSQNRAAVSGFGTYLGVGGAGLIGVRGDGDYIGVVGYGVSSGVEGESSSSAAGATGVHGELYFTGAGPSSAGVLGQNWSNTGNGIGVWGEHKGAGYGVYGSTPPGGYGVVGSNGGSNSSGYAGSFNGRVAVIGTLSKGGGSFKIDHPLDPANKYLSHSFVESPDMMNIYNGNTTTDAKGFAKVVLPDWFEALNRDFRYQLTVIGQFAQAIVAEEIKDNRFLIQTDKPGVKVSWQVTGIRHDPFAEAHRIPVEEPKTGDERGRYLYPDVYGKSVQESIWYASSPNVSYVIDHPEAMERPGRPDIESLSAPGGANP